MNGALVADLGLGPGIWFFLTLLTTITLFFKFGRFWSVRNLDLLLIFAPAAGLLKLVGSGSTQPWGAYAALFIAAGLWLTRCLLDLGLARRPLLEPNLNASGLTCAVVGMLGLMAAEGLSMPVDESAARNPADLGKALIVLGRTSAIEKPVEEVIRHAPLPEDMKRNPARVTLARGLAVLAQLSLCGMLIAIGSRHFGRPVLGLAVATCYLVSPYARIALVDGGQVVPAALIAGAILLYMRPIAAGVLIGLASGWMPACLALIPLWAGFYSGRNRWRYSVIAVGILAACAILGHFVPVLAEWSRFLGARSLAEAGLLPGIEGPHAGTFWTRIDAVYRLPVLIAYIALVCFVTLWPAQKNLGELIALSAALLVASQFWFLDEGGTMISLSLPLFLLMAFRPNLASKRSPPPPTKAARRPPFRVAPVG